jgi:hypothetical protein
LTAVNSTKVDLPRRISACTFGAILNTRPGSMRRLCSFLIEEPMPMVDR